MRGFPRNETLVSVYGMSGLLRRTGLDFKSSEMAKEEVSLYLFLTFGKKTLQAALAIALSRCSGVLAIPQLEFSSKLRRTLNLKQKV